MRYYEFLQLPEVKKALRNSDVQHVQPLLDDHVLGDLDWAPQLRRKFIDEAIILEITARKKFVEQQKSMDSMEETLRPHRERDAKIKAVWPVVEKYVAGNLQECYQSIERGAIRLLSEKIVDKYSDQIQLDESGSIVTGPAEPKTEGLSELDKILAQARITRLNHQATVEEMVYSEFHNSGIAPLLK